MPTFSTSEIDAMERGLGVTLPGLYRTLLVHVGSGPVGDVAEIYHPSIVRELYEPFFDDPGQLFHPYFPFGCHKRKQELWVIDSAKERAAVIWHETVPDDWPEEEWLPYETWIRQHLEPASGSEGNSNGR